jgi:hypothetical protein
MPEDEGTSCQLCLQADEATSMVAVEIPHHLIEGAAPILLCRQCVASIAAAAHKALEAEAPEVEDENDRTPE